METTREKLLEIVRRDMSIYDSLHGYPKKIEEVRYGRYSLNKDLFSLEIAYNDGELVTLCVGKDFREVEREYLEDLKLTWDVDSLEEFELLLESRGF